MLTLLLALGSTIVASRHGLQDGDALFRERVAPILEVHCLRCHDDRSRKGDLSFLGAELPDGLVEPLEPDSSLLIEMVSGTEPDMPRNADPLSAADVQSLRDWILAGSPWVPDVLGVERWWSLRPLDARSALAARPEMPSGWSDWARGPIDAFILDSLLEQGLEPSEEADKRTLLRRLHFDLVGLPPEPERVAAFLGDTANDAYDREVDRLLASPQYGERWARHWLDVVHYADTHGYDKDKPRPNAWPYRDYVIRAFNDDLPWGQFVAEQIAGDVLEGAGPDGIVATGMLAAGPWDFVGHVELREGTIDKKKTRNLDRDDIVTTVCSSFQSLTVHCARCHDHKFDPIPQSDYYNLQAVFSGVERADREFDPDADVAALRTKLARDREDLLHERRTAEEVLDRRMAEDAGESIAALRTRREAIRASVPAPDRSAALGYHSQIEQTAEVEKWVRIDLGEAHVIERVSVHPCDEVFGGHPGPGFGLPASFTVRIGPESEATDVGTWRESESGDRHGDRPITFDLEGAPSARFVEVRVPVLWERTSDYCFALAELEVWSDDVNVALGAAVSSTDSIEAGDRWGERFLVDGKGPWSAEMARLDEADRAWSAARAQLETAAEQGARAARDAALLRVDQDQSALPERSRVYTVATQFAPTGAFTPPPDGAPRAIHRLARGDVEQPREASTPGAISVLDHAPSTFDVEAEGDRRVALARWIAHPENPLTWRSAVNRVWQFHFGRGLVATPNDFGRMGELPSHPELLEFLAVRFRDGGGSLKSLHREIVTSATYRQSSAHRAEAATIDGRNRYLWRANRRRLEAEALRDSILAATGNLQLGGGGPGFRLFGFEDDHSPRYLYDQVDSNDPTTFRRSIYRFVVRSVPDPWMTAFDCADPSHVTAARTETTTPLQALSLLNDQFTLAQADRFAVRLRDEAAGAGASDPITRAVWLTWQRAPTPDEHRLLSAHAEEFGLAAVCRVLFNSNEFLYVD